MVSHSPLFLASATSVYPPLFTITQHYSHPSGIDWSLPHISHLSDPPGDPAMMAQTQAGLHSPQHPRRRPTYLIFRKPIIVTAQYQPLLSNPETGGQLLPFSVMWLLTFSTSILIYHFCMFQLSGLFSSMKPSTFATDPIQKRIGHSKVQNCPSLWLWMILQNVCASTTRKRFTRTDEVLHFRQR